MFISAHLFSDSSSLHVRFLYIEFQNVYLNPNEYILWVVCESNKHCGLIVIRLVWISIEAYATIVKYSLVLLLLKRMRLCTACSIAAWLCFQWISFVPAGRRSMRCVLVPVCFLALCSRLSILCTRPCSVNSDSEVLDKDCVRSWGLPCPVGFSVASNIDDTNASDATCVPDLYQGPVGFQFIFHQLLNYVCFVVQWAWGCIFIVGRQKIFCH